MRIRQYAHFVVGSEKLDPDQITSALNVQPTGVSRRGSRTAEPPIPRFNLWRYRATSTGVLDELIRELLDLFEPRQRALQGLCVNDDGSWIEISFMRSFDDPEGVEEDDGPAELPDNLMRLEGQHQLLGFHLDTELMRRLVALDCALDFDEYG